MSTNEVRAVRAIARTARLFEVALDDLELSLGQYRMLVLLDGGDRAASRMADHLAVSRPSVTAMVDNLASRGLVHRWTPEDDRRRVIHELTDAGRALLGEADQRLAAWLGAVAEHGESPVLLAGLAELHDALDAARDARDAEPAR